MNRKLILLNLLLLALIGLCAWRLRLGWLDARAREQAFLNRYLNNQPIKPGAPDKPAAPVSSANYLEVAQRLLFSKDRNPNVEIEVVPPKQMPPLPLLYGVMLFTDPPVALLSEKAGTPNHGFRPGEKIGEFQLVGINARTLEFLWNGEKIVKSHDELRDRRPVQEVAAPAPTPVAAAPAKQSTVIASSASGPGVDVGAETRACSPGDSAAPGTVQDGYRKVVSESPFGKICRWEKVR